MAEREEEGREPDSRPRGEEQGEVGEQGREELGRKPDSWVVEGQGGAKGRACQRLLLLCVCVCVFVSLYVVL